MDSPTAPSDRALQPTPTPSTDELVALLETCATALVADAPHDPDGDAELVALMPCEPVSGRAAVACWRSISGGEMYELVRLNGTRITDTTALREALVLLAMVESAEEQLSDDSLAAAHAALTEWRDRYDSAPGADDMLGMPELRVALTQACDEITTAREALAPDLPRIAQAELLDAWGDAARRLEHAWQSLEQAAEMHSTPETQKVDGERVRELWRALGVGRHGPLRAPLMETMQHARESGRAMFDAVREQPTKE